MLYIKYIKLTTYIVCLGFVCFLFAFQGRISLYNSASCPGTHCVDQAGLKLTETVCLCLPSARIKGMRHHCPACSIYFTTTGEGGVLDSQSAVLPAVVLPHRSC